MTSEGPSKTSGPASDRVRLRRGKSRGSYGSDVIRAILDAGMVAHFGVNSVDGPIVIPLAYGRSDDWLYLHGSAANGALRASVGAQVCATVTLVDGVIFARSPFHNSMRYRSVVIRGAARRVTGEEHLTALRLISDHVAPNWDTGRLPSEEEVRRTMVIAVSLDEASAKVRTGDPADEPEDLAGPHWAGSVPINTTWGDIEPSADLAEGITVPLAIASLPGKRVAGP